MQMAMDGYPLNSQFYLWSFKTMAEVNIAQKVHVGPAGTLKGNTTNLEKEAKQADAKAEAEGKLAAIPAGGKKYKTRGTSNFSVSGIKFGGPYYVTSNADEIEILDDCVKRGLLNDVTPAE